MLGMLFGGEVPQIPVWEFSDQVLGVFNDAAGTEAFVSFSGLDLSQGKNLGLPGAAFDRDQHGRRDYATGLAGSNPIKPGQY